MPAFQCRATAWTGLVVRFLAFLLAGLLGATNAAAASGTTAPDRLPAGTSAARIVPVEILVTEALQGNPEIAAARGERDAARERVSPAGTLEDPMLEAGVLNAPLPSLSFRREDMTMKMLGLSQRLPFPGKRDLRRQVAAREADAVGYAYQETVNRVVLDVKAAYFDLATVIESTQLAQKTRQVLEQFLDIARARYTVGRSSQADVLRAQTQLSRLDNELIRLDQERPVIEAELIRLLGRRTDDGAPAVAPIPEGLHSRDTPLPMDTLREAAFAERPQLLALQTLIARNEKALELARREYYPDFDVRLAYGQRADTLDGFNRDDMVSLTVGVKLPIWRKSKLAPQVAEAIAMRRQASAMYAAQENEVTAGLRQQVVTAEQSLKSARLYETAILPQARLTVESSVAAYKVDRVDFLTLLDSQMTLFDYEISYVTVLSNYNKAIAEIDFLTGKSEQ
jgi:outer membrane protein TolC